MKLSKNQVVAISLIVLAIVMSPIMENWAKKPKDSFPLSYYPMFSKKRDTTYGVYHVVGYDSTETRIDIPYRMVGTGGFNQVRRQIKKARKKDRAIPFLEKAAERIKSSDKALYRSLIKLELVKGYYHLENYFLNNDTLPVLERNIAKLKIR